MKRLLLLTFLTFLVVAGINALEEKFGKSESFVKAIHESLSTEHSTWLRNHNAAKSGNPIEPGIKFLAHHNIPSDIPLIPSPEHLVATNQFGVKCDQGYTGDFCNILKSEVGKKESIKVSIPKLAPLTPTRPATSALQNRHFNFEKKFRT
uniref:Uncharacterized protein n=1 Tax=Panagrolaimus davidi TaxID=227884 RepID=A0A914PAV7_9BILA